MMIHWIDITKTKVQLILLYLKRCRGESDRKSPLLMKVTDDYGYVKSDSRNAKHLDGKGTINFK